MAADRSPAPSPAGEDAASSVSVTDLSNRTLGDFRLIRRLGKGGMADVYLADQMSLQRQVAVKVLRSDFLSDATYVKRFRHEATAAGGLNHPNIVQVYSVGEQDGVQYIAQEYVRGGTLRDFMRRKGPLDVPIALHIMKQVAAALQVAGDKGIVHRDIKPENILLTRKGEAKVADFGLAQLTLGGERVALTQVGVTMGTPLYMSPEQVGGKPVDQRSDIYSFGAMCYHMLAGRPPFVGDAALAVAVQHINETPTPLKELRPDLPQAVCDLVQKMMAKKREDRYPDAQTLLNDIKALSRSAGGKGGAVSEAAFRTSATPTARGPASGRQSLRRQVGWFALAAVLVAAASAGVGWAMKPGDPFLTKAPEGEQVPRLPTIQAQYFHAMKSGDSEQAWQAVVDYPNDGRPGQGDMERQSAEVRLGLIYLQQNRLADAERIFQHLRQDGAANPWKEAHGLAGEAIIASLRGDPTLAKTLVSQVERRRSSTKLDRKLSQFLDEVKERLNLSAK